MTLGTSPETYLFLFVREEIDMKVRTTKRKLLRNAKRAKNPLRIDPTRTVTLQRAFETILRKRFLRLKAKIVQLIVDDDALGLNESSRVSVVNVFCPTGEGGGVDSSCSPHAIGESQAVPADHPSLADAKKLESKKGKEYEKVISSFDKEAEKLQSARTKEDQSYASKHEKEGEKLRALYAKEDAKRESANEKIVAKFDKEEEKIDKDFEKRSDKIDEELEKLDELETERDDNRSNEDDELGDARNEEDESLQKKREEEDLSAEDVKKDEIEAIISQDANPEGELVTPETQAKLDALEERYNDTSARDDEDAAIEEKRDAEDAVIQERRDKEDEIFAKEVIAKRETLEAEKERLDQEKEDVLAELQDRRDAHEAAVEAENERIEEERTSKDEEREEAINEFDSTNEANREKEDADLETRRNEAINAFEKEWESSGAEDAFEKEWGYRPGIGVYNFNPDQPRDDQGRFADGGSDSSSSKEPTEVLKKGVVASLVAKMKGWGAKAGEIEYAIAHFAKDKIIEGVAKLPRPVQTAVKALYGVGVLGTKVAFSAWTATQALAERVAIERGMTPEEAKAFRGTLSTMDVIGFKPLVLATHHASALVQASTWIVPPATGGYLAYSVARNPVKVAKAAAGLVKDAVVSGASTTASMTRRGISYVGKGVHAALTASNPVVNAEVDNAHFLASALEKHGFDDWYIALFSAAMDRLQDGRQAIVLANHLYTLKKPEGLYTTTENAFCPTGSGGGIDPSCSSVQTTKDTDRIYATEFMVGEKKFFFEAQKDSEGWHIGFGLSSKRGGDTARMENDPNTSPIQVLRHVQSSIQKFIEFKNPETMLFTGEKFESSRVKLYDRLAVDMGKHYGYTPEVHDYPALKEYILRKNPPTTNTRWKFNSDPEKIKAFQEWIKAQLKQEIASTNEEELWKRYIEAGYKKGAGRAFDDTRRSSDTVLGSSKEKLDFYAGTRDEFLRSSFAQPVSVDRVKILAGRAFDELEGVTDSMATRMSRELTDGLVEGSSPREIAKDLAKEVDIGLDRSIVIARTEIIRAHSEGQLSSLKKLGVKKLGVQVEWLATDDKKTCPICADMEGTVVDIDKASGMIPRHPNCRCTWIPLVESPDDEEDDKKDSADDTIVEDKEAPEEEETTENYSEDQPRDSDGRFASGGGDGNPPEAQGSLARLIGKVKEIFSLNDGQKGSSESNRKANMGDESNLKGLEHFTPTTTLKEAQRHARNNLGIEGEVNLGPNLDAANHILAGLTAMKVNGAQMPRSLRFDGREPNFTAAYSTAGGSLMFGHGYINHVNAVKSTPSPFLKAEQAKGIVGEPKQFSTADPHHALVHEIGHLQHHRGGKGYGDPKGEKAEMMESALRETGHETSGYVKDTRDYNEYVAEMYAGKTLGRTYSPRAEHYFNAFGGTYP